jgi:glycyl-tRNA synthetase
MPLNNLFLLLLLILAGFLTDGACHAQEDERIRNNRLALLRKIESLPKGIAELSVLPGF